MTQAAAACLGGSCAAAAAAAAAAEAAATCYYNSYAMRLVHPQRQPADQTKVEHPAPKRFVPPRPLDQRKQTTHTLSRRAY